MHSSVLQDSVLVKQAVADTLFSHTPIALEFALSFFSGNFLEDTSGMLYTSPGLI